MPVSTIFKNFNQPIEDKALQLITKDIKEGKYKSEVERIRQLISDGDFETADMLKKDLPAFTPSARFKGGRKLEFLDRYSNFIHLDFDKLDEEELASAFIKICECPFTFSSFKSPGGKGLKVLIEINSGPEHHDVAYKQVQSYYENLTGLLCDPKCKDITRLCFVSFDSECYRNIHNTIFEIKVEKAVEQPSSNFIPHVDDWQKLFEECISFTEKKEQYIDGNRNNFIYMLASNCNRKGIPEEVSFDKVLTSFDLPEHEIKASVKSAYHHHSSEFANFAKSAKTETVTNEEATEDYLKATPLIPSEIYEQLPDILKSGSLAMTEPRERDVFFTGALSILSGCLPKVQGLYDRQVIFPNLFSFIIAPAASGKGALKFSKRLADKHHDNVLSSSRSEKTNYEEEYRQYKSRQSFRKKTDPMEAPPEQPPFRVVYIPANISYAKILWHLQQNEGEGIICETEADTMGNVLKQEWGSYSDMLRKAFHHERLSSSKKTNDEYIEIENPRLSVAISGTPNQVTGLIASAEDGLFSRFMFYTYKVEQSWKDVSPYANALNLTTHFDRLSDDVFRMIQFLAQSPTQIHLTKEQWQILNETFNRHLSEVTSLASDEAGSIIKRLGLILYRMAMLFTAMRKFEQDLTFSDMKCTDNDFQLALQLSEIYLQHSLLMFHNLPRQNEINLFRNGNNKHQFFQALPASFKRSDAIEIGLRYHLSERSVDSLLKKLIGIKLSQPTYGNYTKD